MDQRRRAVVASGAVVGMFLLVQFGALALLAPFETAGYQPPVEDPQDPTNSIAYVLLLLVMTGILLLVIRWGVQWILRVFVVAAGAYLGLFVFRILLPPVVTLPIDGFSLNVLAWVAAAVLGIALWAYPEWYVIDAAGVVMGAGGGALFGISFGVLPALVLLSVLAVYDAVSVYGTEHMLTLASGVMDLKIPIVLVVPLSLSYSYLDADLPDPAADEPDRGRSEEVGTDADGAETRDESAATDGIETGDEPGETGTADESEATGTADESGATDTADETGAAEPDPLNRNALFIGLGDAVIPTVLVASVAHFATESVPTVDLIGFAAPLPALTAIGGTTVGLVILLRMVLRGRAHAGLPLLNGGAIAGYLVGAVASGITLVEALGIGPYV